MHMGKQTPTCDAPPKIIDWLKAVATSPQHAFTFDDVLFLKLKAATCRSSDYAGLKDILFVVMCSKDKQERIGWMLEGWLHWVDKQDVVLLAGERLPGYNITMVPPLAVDGYVNQKFPNPNNYEKANLRQLKALYWLGSHRTLSTHKWVFFVDDDTFVNVPKLVSFVGAIPPSLPLLIGHIWTSPGWSWPSGGAGMLMSMRAVQQVSSVLFSPRCESDSHLNDVTLGKCTVPANVTKVHSSLFLPEASMLHNAPSGTLPRLDAAMVVTTHRFVVREQMRTATCLVADRSSWPHESCVNATLKCGAVCLP